MLRVLPTIQVWLLKKSRESPPHGTEQSQCFPLFLISRHVGSLPLAAHARMNVSHKKKYWTWWWMNEWMREWIVWDWSWTLGGGKNSLSHHGSLTASQLAVFFIHLHFWLQFLIAGDDQTQIWSLVKHNYEPKCCCLWFFRQNKA